MATLEKIRGRAGFLVAVIGIALLAFLAGDLISGGTTLFRDREMNAFTINGKAMKAQDFEERVQRASEQMKAQGQEASDEATMQMLRNQVYNAYVTEQLLKEEAEKIGLGVSADETFDLVQGDFISPIILQNPMFVNPETGAFDKQNLLRFLKTINAKSAGQSAEEQAMMQQARSMWLETENSIRTNRLYEKYHNMIAKGVVSNKLEVEQQVSGSANVADIAYVAQSVASIPDSIVSVTADDLKAYYDTHKELFRTDGAAVLDLVYTGVTPSEADYADAKSRIDAAHRELLAGESAASVVSEYSDNSYVDVFVPVSDLRGMSLSADELSFVSAANVGDVSPVFATGDRYSVLKIMERKSAPESLHVRHIVLAPEGTPGMASADSIFNIVKADPAQFATVASGSSLDRNSSANGGEIGWLTEAMATGYVSPDFCKAIYSASIGVPFRFTSQYGEHIILVDEARENVDKVKIALVSHEVKPSSETSNAAYSALSTFLAENKEKSNFDSLAMNAGFQVLTDLNVEAAQPYVAPGLMDTREVVKWAMNNKPGEVSGVITSGDRFMVAKVKEKIKAGYIPLNSISDRLRPVVVAEKKVDTLYDRIKGKSYSSLETFASEVGASVDTLHMANFNTGRFEVVGNQPALNSVAAFAPLNKVTPVKGMGNVFLVNVLSRAADAVAPTAASIKRDIDTARAGVIRMQIMQEVIRKADIKDTRYKFM